MADYDSDSSGDERDDLQTNVLLGFASREPTSDDFSQLGGLPTWLETKPGPSGVYSKCKVCNGPVSLFLQLNADLPDRFPGHERRLYILGCRRKACRRKDGCVRALRSGRVSKVNVSAKASTKDTGRNPAAQPQPSPANLGDTLFGAKSPMTGSINPFASSSSNGNVAAVNPFATSSSASTAANASSTGSSQSESMDTLPATFAEKARLTPTSDNTNLVVQKSPSAPWEPWLTDPAPFPKYHLDADSEYLDSDVSMEDVPSNARLDTTSEAGSSAADDKAAFESTLDKTFQRFADRLSQNPEQVLRYEFDGEPLLYSKSDAVGKLLSQPAVSGNSSKVQTTNNGFSSTRIPRCQNCGATRVFELQLTPHAITELEVDEMGLDGMDWGSIIVGTCTADCQSQDANDVSYVEEWVGVQWEEAAEAAKKPL